MIRTWRTKSYTPNIPIVNETSLLPSPEPNVKHYGFNKARTTSNIESFCLYDNNISLLECQQYCPPNDPTNRSPWCDNAMMKYCQTDQGKTDPLCSCLHSTLPSSIPSACFDPVCAEQGYKFFDHYPSANQCLNYCDQLLSHPISGTLNQEQINKVCQIGSYSFNPFLPADPPPSSGYDASSAIPSTQPITQSTNQPTTQSTTQPTTQSTTQPTTQPIIQPTTIIISPERRVIYIWTGVGLAIVIIIILIILLILYALQPTIFSH